MIRIASGRRLTFDFQETANQNWEDSEANLYWKYKAVEFYNKTQEADKVQEKLDNLSNWYDEKSLHSIDFIR